jgi:hypothetical protein
MAENTDKNTAAERAADLTERAADLSDEVLKSVESGQRAAIDAVRKFVDTVDEALPPHGEGASRRQAVIDAAMEMSDRLVHTQYDFLRKVVHSAGESLGKSAAAKK